MEVAIAFTERFDIGDRLDAFMQQGIHPNRKGHDVVTVELAKRFEIPSQIAEKWANLVKVRKFLRIIPNKMVRRPTTFKRCSHTRTFTHANQ